MVKSRLVIPFLSKVKIDQVKETIQRHQNLLMNVWSSLIFRIASELIEENKDCPVHSSDHAQAHVHEAYVDMVTPTFQIIDEIQGQLSS